jgi:peptide chain release factor subunit 1
MQANEITHERLRHLAGVRPDRGKVLSLYLNLDPTEFGTAPARSTEVKSLLNQAERLVREEERLTHDERTALRSDLDRVRAYLGGSLDAEGAHGLAVFCSSAADLFEVVKLPRAIAQGAIVDDVPHVEPLARIGARERWCVLLASRRVGRILCGSRDGLQEGERVEASSPVLDPTGTFPVNDNGTAEHEIQLHLKRVSEAMLRHAKREGFDWLLVGGSQDLVGELESRLHPDVRRKLVGRVDVDVEYSSPDDVLAAAVPQIDWHARQREDEALNTLSERLGKGTRAAAGLEDVLSAINERRVEQLFVEDGLTAFGARCPSCGWLGLPAATDACPADGTALAPVRDVVEATIECAIAQSADVQILGDRPELGSHGGIAALLRF